MASFFVAVTILSICLSFCDGVKYDYNVSVELRNITSTLNRRRLVNIANFNGVRAFLNGVGAIHYTLQPAGSTYCSGAYITPPAGFTPAANKYYFVTAGHCLYKRDQPSDAAQWINLLLANIRVEFGLTNSAPRGDPSITTCTVDDYRVWNEWVMSNNDMMTDYAVMKLNCNVAPTNPFTIRNFVNSRREDQEFEKAGYRGARVLMTEEHYRMRKSDHKRGTTDYIGGVMMSRGISGGGDSGAPIYDANAPHYLRAIHTGFYLEPKVKSSIKITKNVHKNIDNMIKEIDGIARRTVDCDVSPFQNTECWSKCILPTGRKPPKCFSSYDRTHDYLSPNRALPCGFGRVKYLCGPIQDCSRADKDKKCLSDCTNDLVNSNCPATRPNMVVASLPSCKGRSGFSSYVGVKYVCRDIGHAVINCADGTYNDRECWSGYHQKRQDGICFESATQVREYHKSARKSEGIAVEKRHRWLCGPVKDCTSDFRDKRCMSKCTDTGVANCPPHRALIAGITIPCAARRGIMGVFQQFNGVKYLCDNVDTIPNCGVGYEEEECWGPCTYTKDPICYTAPLQTRGYAKSKRFKKCGVQDQKYQRLCSTIKDCSGGVFDADEVGTKRCLGNCRDNSGDSCPGTRTRTHETERIGCGTGRFKWFCSSAAYDEDYGDEYIQYDDYQYYDDGINDDGYYEFDVLSNNLKSKNNYALHSNKINYIQHKINEMEQDEKEIKNSLQRLYNQN